MQIDDQKKIYVAGSTGMVGSAIIRKLRLNGMNNIITKTHKELNLTDSKQTSAFFEKERPNIVFFAAAKVGGIKANMQYPAEFIYENLMMQNNVIHNSYLYGVNKFVFIGSSCIYPKNCSQPMKETGLLDGKLEPTNESYAIAKIAGIKMCQAYHNQYGLNVLNMMPCNLYGPNDCFDLEKSHVLSAIVKKVCDAKKEKKTEVTLWGTGIARREFMHTDDFADALLFLIKKYDSPEIINVGTGIDISVKELAEIAVQITKYNGEIIWDKSMPDGMLRKCMDISRLSALGFNSNISLEEGINSMIIEYTNAI